MEAQLELIREQQKDSWNKFSPGWKKWDALMMDFLKPKGDAIIEYIHPSGNDLVLDIASGTGEPGLTIARMLSTGKVIATDVSDEMLVIARENALKRGINNFETKVCDVSELPFEDNTFDSISCRFGFMFFPDMLMAAKEMARVIKRGGRIATSVWNISEKNFWITAMGGTIAKHMSLPPSAPEAPGMFRCAKHGLIQGIFETAGLKNVTETEVKGKLNVGNATTYWTMMTEVAAPFVAALSKADEDTKAAIKKEVFDLLHHKYPNGNVVIDSSALIICGEK